MGGADDCFIVQATPNNQLSPSRGASRNDDRLGTGGGIQRLDLASHPTEVPRDAIEIRAVCPGYSCEPLRLTAKTTCLPNQIGNLRRRTSWNETLAADLSIGAKCPIPVFAPNGWRLQTALGATL